jgi:hypothetical protein
LVFLLVEALKFPILSPFSSAVFLSSLIGDGSFKC